MDVSLNCSVFGWQTKSVPSHRVYHLRRSNRVRKVVFAVYISWNIESINYIVSCHFSEPADSITNSIYSNMAHMQHATWVREHGQDVKTLSGCHWWGGWGFRPAFLPFFLNVAEVQSTDCAIRLRSCIVSNIIWFVYTEARCLPQHCQLHGGS
jgi:hypothetical protein